MFHPFTLPFLQVCYFSPSFVLSLINDWLSIVPVNLCPAPKTASCQRVAPASPPAVVNVGVMAVAGVCQGGCLGGGAQHTPRATLRRLQ